jgi:hypothetical protein
VTESGKDCSEISNEFTCFSKNAQRSGKTALECRGDKKWKILLRVLTIVKFSKRLLRYLRDITVVNKTIEGSNS